VARNEDSGWNAQKEGTILYSPKNTAERHCMLNKPVLKQHLFVIVISLNIHTGVISTIAMATMLIPHVHCLSVAWYWGYHGRLLLSKPGGLLRKFSINFPSAY